MTAHIFFGKKIKKNAPSTQPKIARVVELRQSQVAPTPRAQESDFWMMSLHKPVADFEWHVLAVTEGGGKIFKITIAQSSTLRCWSSSVDFVAVWYRVRLPFGCVVPFSCHLFRWAHCRAVGISWPEQTTI